MNFVKKSDFGETKVTIQYKPDTLLENVLIFSCLLTMNVDIGHIYSMQHYQFIAGAVHVFDIP